MTTNKINTNLILQKCEHMAQYGIHVVDEIGTFTTADPVDFRCDKCGQGFNRLFSAFYFGKFQRFPDHACPICFPHARQHYKKHLPELKKRKLELVEPYQGYVKYNNFKCLKCNLEFSMRFSEVITYGRGCPECSKTEPKLCKSCKHYKYCSENEELESPCRWWQRWDTGRTQSC